MAKFNEDQNPVQADYTSDSRGYRPDTSMATLFSAAGDTAINAVKIADKDNLINIQKKVYEGVDQLNDEWGISNENVNTPQDLIKYSEKLGNTRKAYMNGTLTDSSYQFKVDAMTRQIRAQYPGYRDEVDSIVQKTLGQSTANDLRKSLMQLWTSEAAKQTEADKEKARIVDQAREKGALPTGYDAREASGNPYTWAETITHISSVYQQDADQKRRHDDLDLMNLESTAGKQAAFDSASKDISVATQRMFSGLYSVNNTTLPQLRELATRKTPLSPAEKEQLGVSVRAWKTNVSAEISNMLSQPRYATLTGDQRTALLKQATDQIDFVNNAYTNDKWGIINFSQTLNDMGVQDRLANLRAMNPDLDTLSAVAKLSNGSAVLDSVFLNNPKMSSKLNDAVAGFLAYKVLDPNVKSLDQAFETTKNQTGQAVAPEVQKQTVQNALSIITMKDAGTDVALEAARKLFSEENQGFLSHYDTKSQDKLVNLMASPRITERMWELGKSDPNAWKNYISWTLNAGFALFNQDINQVIENNKSGDNFLVKWNSDKGKVEVLPNPAAASRAQGNSALGQLYNKWNDSEANKSVNRLNDYISKIKPIIEKDGGTVEEAVGALFDRLGVNKQQNTGSLFFKINEALKGSEMQGKAPEAGSRGYRGAVTGKDYPELEGINLDETGSGKLAADTRPRGIRNNNPGNIEMGAFAKENGATGSDGRFAKFDTPEQGVQAMYNLLENYQKKGLDTVSDMIGRWSPKDDNNTEAYAKKVAKDMGIGPDEPFLFQGELANKMIKSMIEHENGGNPYQDAVINPTGDTSVSKRGENSEVLDSQVNNLDDLGKSLGMPVGDIPLKSLARHPDAMSWLQKLLGTPESIGDLQSTEKQVSKKRKTNRGD